MIRDPELILLPRPWLPRLRVIDAGIWKSQGRKGYELSVVWDDNSAIDSWIPDPPPPRSDPRAFEEWKRGWVNTLAAAVRDGTARGESRWRVLIDELPAIIERFARRPKVVIGVG